MLLSDEPPKQLLIVGSHLSRLAIIYFSQTGTTHQIATAVAEGANQFKPGSCQLHRITGSEIVNGRFINEACLAMIDEADAICFGSPTYMGGPAAQFKAFADASSERWETQRWSGKAASGFTVGINPGGDQLATLQYFSVLAAQQGMVWVGLDKPQDQQLDNWNTQGTQLGFSAYVTGDTISESDVATAQYLGERIVKVGGSLSTIRNT
ncbi:MAG: flavodoxin family protein [Granulosicoccus sp.]